ncbi:hypothetical protein Tco_0799043 [Tanacetum coccineum]
MNNTLVAQDGIGGYDWSYQTEEEHPINFALMTHTSLGSSSSEIKDSENALVRETKRKIGKNDEKERDGVKTETDIKEWFKIHLKSIEDNLLGSQCEESNHDVCMLKEIMGNPQQKEYKEKGVIDSGCSRHMTGNK